MKWKLPVQSLHHKLILVLFFCMLIPVLVVGTANFVLTSNLFANQLERSSEAILSQTAGQLEQVYREFKTAERLFLQDEDFIASFINTNLDIPQQVVNSSRMSETIASAKYINPSFKIAVIVDEPHYLAKYGLPVRQDPATLDAVIRRADGSWRRAFLLGDERGQPAFRWLVPFGSVVTGRVYGCLEIRVPYSMLSQLLDKSAPGGQSQLLFVDREGGQVVRQGSHRVPVDPDAIRDMLASGSGSHHPSANPELSVFKRTIGEEWTLVGLIPREQMLSPLTKLHQWTIGLILSQAALTLFLAISLAKNFSKPIRRLAGLLARKKSEGAGIFIPQVKRNDEIRALYDGIRELLAEIRQEQIQKKEYQLRMLQYQINPHFLYNSLDSIHWKAIEHKDKVLAAMINNLCTFLRHGLKQTDVVTIEEELRHLNSYLQLQQIRYNGQFTVSVQVDEALMRQRITKISLQPLVENAILYGMSRQSGGSRIEIRGEKMGEDRIVISVVDDGKCLDLAKVLSLLSQPEREPASFGIRNVHERIKLYFGEPYGLSVGKTPEGTRFDMTLPYRRDGPDDCG